MGSSNQLLLGNAVFHSLDYAPNEMTLGFRTMAAMQLNEMGWNTDTIERQLGHDEQNELRRAYTHGAKYWLERVAMMQAWADYLD